MTAISCDPNGDLLTSHQIDKQAENILRDYGGLMSPDECADFKNTIDKIKGYVWQQRRSGIKPTRTNIANFIYDLSAEDGTIKNPDKSERQIFADFVQNNTWSGDQTAVINTLAENKYFSSDMAEVLHGFKAEFENVRNYSDAYTLISEWRGSKALSTLSKGEHTAFQQALDGAERSVCYEELSESDVSSRWWCEECSYTLHWGFVIISLVVTAVAWILAVVTFGLSTLVTSVVLVAVWTATWVLTCIWVWCEDQTLCPDGQQPVCEGSFTFDESIPACTHAPFAEGDFQFGDCIMSPVPASGNCPPVSTRIGSNCLWECFTGDTPVINADGNWLLPFTCQ